MKFSTWIQMNVDEQIEYLQTTPVNEILLFISHICSINIEKSKTIIIYIDKNRILQRKLNSLPNIKSIEKGSMKKMCDLCKSKREE